MAITPKVKQQLKAKAHQLKPVVIIGNQGLSEAVKKEIDRALHDHELIKLKIASHDRESRQQMAAEICASLHAEAVQLIGSMSVIYRKKEEK